MHNRGRDWLHLSATCIHSCKQEFTATDCTKQPKKAKKQAQKGKGMKKAMKKKSTSQQYN